MAPSLVQVKSGTGTTSPITVTLTSATTAGNCLVVAVGEGNSTTNPTVTGITLGGSADNFAIAASLKNNSDANVEIWTDQNCAGGQTSVAVSFNAGTGAGNGYTVFVYEFSGVATASAVDKTNATGAASGSTWTSGSSGTLSSANEVAVGIGVGIGSAGAPTVAGPSSPWINETAISAARTESVSGYQVVSATTALTYSGTISAGRNAGVIVTLKGFTGVNVNLGTATVLVAAEQPTIINAAPIGPAVIQVAAQAPTPVSFNGPVVSAGIIHVAAQQVTPVVNVNLGTAVVQVTAEAVTPVTTIKQLIFSVAPTDGTDQYGYTYLAGSTSYNNSTPGVTLANNQIGATTNFYVSLTGPSGTFEPAAEIDLAYVVEGSTLEGFINFQANGLQLNGTPITGILAPADWPASDPTSTQNVANEIVQALIDAGIMTF
jgi:hypothetical protein